MRLVWWMAAGLSVAAPVTDWPGSAWAPLGWLLSTMPEREPGWRHGYEDGVAELYAKGATA